MKTWYLALRETWRGWKGSVRNSPILNCWPTLSRQPKAQGQQGQPLCPSLSGNQTIGTQCGRLALWWWIKGGQYLHREWGEFVRGRDRDTEDGEHELCDHPWEIQPVQSRRLASREQGRNTHCPDLQAYKPQWPRLTLGVFILFIYKNNESMFRGKFSQ